MSEEQTEIWGCWDGSEVVSVIEPSKEGAIEVYANDYLLGELQTETETRNFSAEVSKGRPVLAVKIPPSLKRTC